MILYLLRHAEAAPYCEDDYSRPLTTKGIAQAGRIGEFFKEHLIDLDLVLSSPVTRARETAEIVAEKLGISAHEPTISAWLACGMSPDTALQELQVYAKLNSVMIVGHEPDFSSMVAALIGLHSSSSIDLTKASLTAIELARITPGSGVLQFFLPVNFV